MPADPAGAGEGVKKRGSFEIVSKSNDLDGRYIVRISYTQHLVRGYAAVYVGRIVQDPRRR
jgi:hypothetical protein